MSLTLIQNTTQVSVGLVTYTFTIPTASAGEYTVRFQATEIPPSGLVVLVKNGASTILTAPTVGQTQSALQFKFTTLCAAADVITIVMSSAVAADALLNNVKSMASIGREG